MMSEPPSGQESKVYYSGAIIGGTYSLRAFARKVQLLPTRSIYAAAGVAGGALALGGILFFRQSQVQEIKNVVINATGGDRNDQTREGPKPGDSLHFKLHCKTDERFFEVLEECKSGIIAERMEKEFCKIGIEVEGLKVEIENMEEVNRTVKAINKRPGFAKAMQQETSEKEEKSEVKELPEIFGRKDAIEKLDRDDLEEYVRELEMRSYALEKEFTKIKKLLNIEELYFDFTRCLAKYIYPEGKKIEKGESFEDMKKWLFIEKDTPEGKRANEKWDEFKKTFSWTDENEYMFTKILAIRAEIAHPKLDWELAVCNDIPDVFTDEEKNLLCHMFIVIRHIEFEEQADSIPRHTPLSLSDT